MPSETRTMGARGQVTIPKELRDRLGLEGGDEVTVREEDGRIVIDPPVTEKTLAEGYRERARRDRDVAEEMADVSREADENLGDAPDGE